METDDEIIEGLVARCREDFRRWINGDGRGYELPTDGTIFGPFGGSVAFGGSALAQLQREGCRALWLSGEGDIELLAAGTSGDLAWLVYIERAMVTLAGHEDARRWELRITDLFRREPDGWVRFHIHEDACIDPRGLDAVLAQLP